MYSMEVTVNSANGQLVGRNASEFVKLSNQFASDILIEMEGTSVRAKSLLCILALGITPGMTLRLKANGPDEQDAVTAVAAYLSDNQ